MRRRSAAGVPVYSSNKKDYRRIYTPSKELAESAVEKKATGAEGRPAWKAR